MNDMVYNKSQSKAWLDAFLKRRGRSAPSKLPLFSYSTTENEFQLLVAVLSASVEEWSSPTFRKYWSAAYCLYVSEQFRRDYDANWSWKAFDDALGVVLDPAEHKELVIRGMEYWSRPVRYRAHGADYLGTLFAEGGLPWKLVQNESHGFGRAVRAGLKRYHQYRSEGRNLIGVIEEYSRYFPQTFQNEEKYQLLTNIVETLMALAEKHGLNEQDDPAGYLNQKYPEWREEFPLPLEENNGYALVNEWLKDAGVRLAERKQAEEVDKYFTCDHFLDGSLQMGRLKAIVTLAPSLEINIEKRTISSTRIELALYEGEQIALKLGVAYGRLEGGNLEIKLPAEAVECSRRHPEKPLLLSCWCAGEKLKTITIQSSEVDWDNLPAAFVESDDDIRLIGTASVKCEEHNLLVRIPQHLKFQGESPSEKVEGEEKELWHHINTRTVIVDRDSSYVIEPGHSKGVERVELRGELSPYDTLPIATWLGWPRWVVKNAAGEEKQPEAMRIDSSAVTHINSQSGYGSFRVDLLGAEHQVIARRKVGVLPKDFSISSVPASSKAPARVVIKTNHEINVCVLNRKLHSDIRKEAGAVVIHMVPDSCSLKPEYISLKINDSNADAEGVVVRLPYPEVGALLLDSEGSLFKEKSLNVNRILGMTLVMTPPRNSSHRFHLTLELMKQGGRLSRQYTYETTNTSVQVSLFSLYDDIQSLFSCSSEQDAEVRVRVETSNLLKQFYIRRYDAYVRYTNPLCDYFELVDNGGRLFEADLEATKVLAMQVYLPEARSVELPPQVVMESIYTGVFEIPDRLKRNGPWLLYPSSDSKVFFRPAIHVPEGSFEELEEPSNIATLNSAARYFHPSRIQDPFDEVLDKMAGDFMHRSWLYLAELKTHYEHIPLSALEAWKHLARHPQAMALAVFRLEMDSHFVTRLVQELAVVWERVTIFQWSRAVNNYAEGVSKQFGIPAEQVRWQAVRRMELLANQVPAFRYLAEQISGVRNVASADSLPLKILLPMWLQELRSRHEDADWPTNLIDPLTQWIRCQEEFSWMLDLPMPAYMRSVCIIPVFSAFLSAELTGFRDLPADDAAVRLGIRVLSDFDRDGWYEPVYSAVLSGINKSSRSQ